MHLNQEDVSLFFKLWYALIYSINCKHKIVPEFVERPVYGNRVEKAPFVTIKKILWENPSFIDEFLASDGKMLSEEERAVLMSWRANFVSGKFIIYKHLRKYTVFMSTDENPKLYGVIGISEPIEFTLTNPLPCMAETALLPFKGKIIYDSIFVGHPALFGPGVRRSLTELYKKAKVDGGILESLDL
jgi:hypothetical protein